MSLLGSHGNFHRGCFYVQEKRFLHGENEKTYGGRLTGGLNYYYEENKDLYMGE